MTKLDLDIENSKAALNSAINTLGVMDKLTIKLSQKLDKLIVKRMQYAFERRN